MYSCIVAFSVQGPEHVKITDFGLTKILDVGETTYKSEKEKVPVRWLAPESLINRLYTHKSDVWSYGEWKLCQNNFGHNRYVWKLGIMLLC